MWGLALVTGRLDVAVLALLLPAGFVLLNAGQVVPFALAALVFCGVALARGLDRLAGILAALTLIEPHLGLTRSAPPCFAGYRAVDSASSPRSSCSRASECLLVGRSGSG